MTTKDNKRFWTRIGGVWPHIDGNGFIIQLDAVSVDRCIALRVVTDKKINHQPAGRG